MPIKEYQTAVKTIRKFIEKNNGLFRVRDYDFLDKKEKTIYDKAEKNIETYRNKVKSFYKKFITSETEVKRLEQLIEKETFQISYSQDLYIILAELIPELYVKNKISIDDVKVIISCLFKYNRRKRKDGICDDIDGDTPLMTLLSKSLFDYYPSDCLTEEGYHQAEEKYLQLCKIYLEYPVSDINQRNLAGQNAIMIASWHQKLQCELLSSLIIDYGANLNTFDNRGFSALAYIIDIANRFWPDDCSGEKQLILDWKYKITRLFIREGGADINLKNQQGKTLLMQCIDLPPVLEMLISLGADINILDYEGKNALYYAMEEQNEESIKVLLHAGANVNILDYEGKNALYYAMEKQNEEIVRILLQAGAKLPPNISFTVNKDIPAERQIDLIDSIIRKTGDSHFICNKYFLSQVLECNFSKKDKKSWLNFLKDKKLLHYIVIGCVDFDELISEFIEHSDREQIDLLLDAVQIFDCQKNAVSICRKIAIEGWRLETIISNALKKGDKKTVEEILIRKHIIPPLTLTKGSSLRYRKKILKVAYRDILEEEKTRTDGNRMPKGQKRNLKEMVNYLKKRLNSW